MPILIDIYVSRNVTKAFSRLLTTVVRSEPKETKELRQQELRAQLKKHLDESDCVTVFRGEYINAFGKLNNSSRPIHLSASFTLDYEKAKWFATRFYPEVANIYILKIPLAKIAWYTNERKEEEIIVPPLGKGYTKYLVRTDQIDVERYQ